LNIHEINLAGRWGRSGIGEAIFKVIEEPLRRGERSLSRHRKVRDDLPHLLLEKEAMQGKGTRGDAV